MVIPGKEGSMKRALLLAAGVAFCQGGLADAVDIKGYVYYQDYDEP